MNQPRATWMKALRGLAFVAGAVLLIVGAAGYWWESQWTAGFGGDPDYTGAFAAMVGGTALIVGGINLRPRGDD